MQALSTFCRIENIRIRKPATHRAPRLTIANADEWADASEVKKQD